MRARLPDEEGYVERDGVKVAYEVHGNGSPTLLLLPTWTIIHSRFWKMQVPYLSTHYRVVTFDRPGNGRSDRPEDSAAYGVEAVAEHALAVMDATDTDRAVVVSQSQGAQENLYLASRHPDRVAGSVMIGAATTIDFEHPGRASALERFFEPPAPEAEGWARLNAQYWLARYPEFVDFFFSECFSEPHSTKQHEDACGWAAETSPEVLLADGAALVTPDTVHEWARQVTVPTLLIHGDDDRISPIGLAQRLAGETGGDLVVLEGAGHVPLARDPVRVNLLIRDFAERLIDRPRPVGNWTRARSRPKRALFVSSPIGLGHARRDVAIANELRLLHPDLEIDWLAQHPVTRVLEDEGERIHPSSSRLASESSHIESESGEHRLHCFQAWRRMDEILLSDFMVFHDVVTTDAYDLVIGDEAWEVDYYLHENPELKRFAYCWLTDFVGWLPMPDGGDHEAFLTTDYNAEMIEHIARYPRVRDRALFVGSPDDIVPDRFGADLPLIRDWTEDHYEFPGYVTGFDPAAVEDRQAIRHQLGYRPDELVCLVTVDGSGVGGGLLRRLITAYPQARAQVPGLRMLVVAGPRIDPASYASGEGVEVRAYLPDLVQHMAASDLAVVQGGLTTCMELTATNRPFIYVPLGQHFEQQFHVHHRLSGYRAGRRLDFDDTEPDAVAEAIAAEVGWATSYRPVETDGAARAAASIAELL